MDLNKVPRWMLVLIAMLGLGACGLLVSTARADLDKFKSISYQAKTGADRAESGVARLEVAFAKMEQAHETSRKESREDMKEIQKALYEIKTAVKQ